jgi:hypothetical protein
LHFLTVAAGADFEICEFLRKNAKLHTAVAAGTVEAVALMKQANPEKFEKNWL